MGDAYKKRGCTHICAQESKLTAAQEGEGAMGRGEVDGEIRLEGGSSCTGRERAGAGRGLLRTLCKSQEARRTKVCLGKPKWRYSQHRERSGSRMLSERWALQTTGGALGVPHRVCKDSDEQRGSLVVWSLKYLERMALGTVWMWVEWGQRRWR